ncbi:small T antigen [Tadarida brasiliensis polyomavirus 2]|uniref:small T antigen n=1 Tax=Tadarida brasiliensis polyomavirus 2 TaxID=1588049 RepID=UPI000572A3E7|nr:small T antigen [Tadarida brasiliensis polyomavirus 2]AJA41157.1 small T antigen [Tadarida brasiliensis polyomavirus 2]
MDRILERNERNDLIELLGVDSNCFSNFPIMRQAYKKASKKLHPDKGGDSEKMMLLNSLWQKYQEGLIDLRNTQVCEASLLDLFDDSLEDTYEAHVLRELLLKTPQCLVKGPSTCRCISSLLINQHEILKAVLQKRCLVWGECYCYFCFLLWFGLPKNWETYEVWCAVICQMPKKLLQLSILSKYYFY